jgi:hypothetical protein
MAITVKHTKVSTIPDGDDSSLIRPSDWNADHQLVGTIPVDNGGTGASTLTGYVKGNGTSTMTASSTIPNTDITGLGTAATKDSGVANGVASLDGSGTVPISQLPSAVLGALSYQGTWNASTNTPTLTSSVGTKGYYYVVNVAGSTNLNGITDWQVGDWAVYNGTAWQKVDNTDAVTSVNGYTGTVNLTYTDVGAFPATSTTGTGNVVLATGATQANPTISNYENFTPTTAPAYSEGRVWYDSTEKALAFYNDSSSIAVHVSQDLIFKVINNTGSTIPNGSPVYITGTSSGQTYPNVALAKADVAATSAVIGLTNGAIANGAIGYVSSQGTIDNVNTSTFTVGQVLYLSPYSAGQLMNTIPPTGITVQVGVATYIDSSAGHIYVKQTTPLAVPASIITGTLGVDHGGTGATTLTGYVKGSGTSAMTASSTIPTTDLSGTVTNAQLANSAITINGTSTSLGGSISVGTVTSVTGTSPVVSSGGTTPAISMPAATSSVNGYLTSADWTTFNGKQPAGTYVTSVSATSPVTSSGGTTPTIAMPAATTSVSGYLTSTDWNTFNNKGSGTVTSVTGTAPVVSSGGATPAISMAAATGSVNGYLTSTDWTTFNNKASPFTYTTNYIPYGQGTTTPNQSSSLTFDGTALTAPRHIGTVSVSGSGTQGAFAYGTMSYSDTNRLATFQTTVNTYSQVEIQNTNAGAAASSDMVVGNNNTTSTTYYGDFGMNSGGWAGTGAFNSPNNVYLTATTGDLAIGTTTANAIRFAVNGSTTDALTISSTGNVNTPNGIYENSNTINANYTIGTNNNAMSAGPITVATGVTVTVPTGSTWVIV